jgi:hypothetical protein
VVSDRRALTVLLLALTMVITFALMISCLLSSAGRVRTQTLAIVPS